MTDELSLKIIKFQTGSTAILDSAGMLNENLVLLRKFYLFHPALISQKIAKKSFKNATA